MRFIYKIGMVVASLSLTGCTLGNWNSISREFDTQGGDSQLIDVKQRSILVGARYELGADGKQHLVPGSIVCAEPSPDTLSVYGASVAAEGQNPEGVSGSLSGSTTENGVAFGLRTQSIQLLRDAYYRACEAYLSGAVDKETYETLIRRLNNQAIAYLAIEQITGSVSSARPTVDTEAFRALSDLQVEKTQRLQTLVAQKQVLVDKKAALPAPPSTPAAEYTAAQTSIDNKQLEIANAERELGQIEDQILETVEALSTESNRGPALVGAVAAAKEIALSITDADFSGQMCFERFKYKAQAVSGQDSADAKLDAFCKRILEAHAKSYETAAHTMEALQTQLRVLCSTNANYQRNKSTCDDLIAFFLKNPAPENQGQIFQNKM